ncbi:MAG: hypothetical protein D3923_18475, partial [Candidatus Electrothrix sp. AR3]|nr:hypothetical protein [Candidatus Electrothrix sp. AR3]
MIGDNVILREDAVKELKEFGITGDQVYMIDLIPLIEIIWADGQIQTGEIAVLENYIEKHVQEVNKLAGCNVLTFQDVRLFIN